MSTKTIQILKYPCGMMLFIIAAVFSSGGMTVLPMGLFLFICFSEVYLMYQEKRSLLDLRILLTLSWIGGIALSTLKLSWLQSAWGFRMWASVFLFYFFSLLTHDFISGRFRDSGPITPGFGLVRLDESVKDFRKKIRACILMLLILGLLSFVTEIIVFKGELPILSDKPHAYTAFHITGIHYFIVSMIFVPVLAVLYLFSGPVSRKELIYLSLASDSVFLVYVLMLSKLQLVFTVVLPAMAVLLLQRRFRTRTVFLWFLLLLIILMSGLVVLMSLRHYPEGYLEGIFKFRDPDTAPAFQYVYTYVVNNFENLNLLSENLQHYSFGIRQLFPAFALTGLKFLPKVQALMAVERYFTIDELTTVTILYDAYGDFGIAGTALFGIFTGAVNGYVSELFRRKRNLTSIILYVQLAVYMGLAFFTTWFSNPTTWFWFAMTVLITLIMNMDRDGIGSCVRRTLNTFRLPLNQNHGRDPS